MKLKALVITALFLAGVAASVAVAKGPPPGKGKNKTATSSTASTGTGSTTTDKHSAKKLWICHRTGSGKWVKMRINKKAWPAHKRARRPRPRGRARLDRDDVHGEHRLDRHHDRQVQGRGKLRRGR